MDDGGAPEGAPPMQYAVADCEIILEQTEVLERDVQEY